MKCVAYEPASRNNGKCRCCDIRYRRIWCFKDELPNAPVCRKGNRRPSTERKTPDNDLLGRVVLVRECISGLRILQQAGFGGAARRSRISAERYRDQPGASGDHLAKPRHAPGEDVAVAVKEDDDRFGLARANMPRDDFLAIARGKNVLTGFGKTGRCGRRSYLLRDRIEYRALRKIQQRKAAGISEQREGGQPFQNCHGRSVTTFGR